MILVEARACSWLPLWENVGIILLPPYLTVNLYIYGGKWDKISHDHSPLT